MVRLDAPLEDLARDPPLRRGASRTVCLQHHPPADGDEDGHRCGRPHGPLRTWRRRAPRNSARRHLRLRKACREGRAGVRAHSLVETCGRRSGAGGRRRRWVSEEAGSTGARAGRRVSRGVIGGCGFALRRCLLRAFRERSPLQSAPRACSRRRLTKSQKPFLCVLRDDLSFSARPPVGMRRSYPLSSLSARHLAFPAALLAQSYQ